MCRLLQAGGHSCPLCNIRAGDTLVTTSLRFGPWLGCQNPSLALGLRTFFSSEPTMSTDSGSRVKKCFQAYLWPVTTGGTPVTTGEIQFCRAAEPHSLRGHLHLYFWRFWVPSKVYWELSEEESPRGFSKDSDSCSQVLHAAVLVPCLGLCLMNELGNSDVHPSLRTTCCGQTC
jgi:hypothetical protein